MIPPRDKINNNDSWYSLEQKVFVPLHCDTLTFESPLARLFWSQWRDDRIARVGSLSTYDDDGNGNENATSLQWYCTLACAIFFLSFFFPILYVSQPFSFFPWREITCFEIVWTTWALTHKFLPFFLTSKALEQISFSSRIITTHFTSIMKWNKWDVIAEVRDYILRSRSRCRRSSPCLTHLEISKTLTGARFSKVPENFRARKAIHKTATRSFCNAGLFISCNWKGIKIQITARFLASIRIRFDDTMSPERRPKSFGTFEKRAPGH